jgi:subtilisin
MRALRVLVAASLLLLTVAAGSAGATGVERSTYIVVFKPGAVTNVEATARSLASSHDGQLGFVYQHAVQGFSVDLSAQAARSLARNPLVAFVEADQEVRIASTDLQLPTGIDRINADQNSNLKINGNDDFRVKAVVAVIDTGIDFNHPDLNVNTDMSVNCSGGSPFKQSCGSGGNDDNGHGTHVAGTIGALDNGPNYTGSIYTNAHVVGVAPGVELWSIKVLRSDGSGYMSWIVAGIDYVTENAGEVDVANMSLGCECSSAAMNAAISKSVAAGVTYVVAAGNSNKDASTFSPANHDDVITVSALADFDGIPGGTGPPTCRLDEDDTLANFSNWGEKINVTAPGVCILSTWPGGGYHIISGTSMAAPHVAGAAALLAASGVTNPANILTALITTGKTDWTDDSGDRITEPRIDVADAKVFNPAMVGSDTGGGDGGGDTNSPPTATFTFSCTDLACDFDGSGSSASDGTITSYAWNFGDGNSATGDSVRHTYGVSGTYTVTLTVTDSGDITDSDSQKVAVSDGVLSLSGTSTNNGSTWTATVTLTGPETSSTSGTWVYNGTEHSGGCTIEPYASSCTFFLLGIPKRVSSVTYTDSGNSLTVTIFKP